MRTGRGKGGRAGFSLSGGLVEGLVLFSCRAEMQGREARDSIKQGTSCFPFIPACRCVSVVLALRVGTF